MIPETGALAELLRLPEAEKQARGLVHTPAEIARQPELWRRMVAEARQAIGYGSSLFEALLGDPEPPLFLVLAGAGSSFYAAEYAAHVLAVIAGMGVQATPTTDMVLSSPPPTGLGGSDVVLASLARSGNSPESLEAVRIARRASRGMAHIGITCSLEGALAQELVRLGEAVYLLPETSEDQGLAMTASFTALALGAILLGPWTADPDFVGAVDEAARAVESLLAETSSRIAQVAGLGFQRAVVLSAPGNLPIAKEGALKLQELTNGEVATFAETYLGLRHGPQAMVRGDTLVVGLLSAEPAVARYERDLLAELRAKRQGCHFLLVGEGEIPARTRKLADTLIVHPESPPPLLRGLIDVVVLQILGLFTSTAHGLTPDNPSPEGVINRVVQGVKIYKR